MEIKWLNYIPTYIALCEEKSIAGAAQRLNCSNAHVSRQLRQLEDILSIQLIQRTTRRFNLTYDGIEFYRQVKSLLEDAEIINEKLCSAENVTGKLRIAASASFGSLLLSELLAKFCKLYPELEIEVIYTENPVDLIESGFDVAFYFTDSPPQGYVGHYLRALHCKPFAHKSYIKEQGKIAHPSELSKYHHIIYKNTEFTLSKWTFLNTKSDEHIHINLTGTISFNLVPSMIDAMLNGCGVAMLDDFALSKLSETQRKEVIQLIPNWDTSAILPLYILYPKREHLPRRTKLFIDFFRNHLNGIRS